MTNIAQINFHGHALVTAERNGQPHVAMRPIVEAIGLQWEAQYKRIKRHPVLSEGVSIMDMPSQGGTQKTTMLTLSLLNGWLFGVDSSRVKSEIRDTLIMYQRECFDALAAYWQKGKAINPRKRQVKALPNGLTLEQQDTIKSLVKARVEALPPEKRAKAAITCWSSLKSKFGCSYKEIAPEHFTDAVSLVARAALEGELLGPEEPSIAGQLDINYPIEDWQTRNPGQFLRDDPNSSDLLIGHSDLLQSKYSPCLELLDKLHNAGYCIDGAYYELRSYQNLMAQMDITVRMMAGSVKNAFDNFQHDRNRPQRYVDVKSRPA